MFAETRVSGELHVVLDAFGPFQPVPHATAITATIQSMVRT